MYNYDNKIGTFKIDADFYTVDGDLRVEYCARSAWYGSTTRTATVRLCQWAQRLHGNALSGAHYGSFTAILPDGSRRAVRIYL